jgi:hypothetical protein
MLASGGGRAEAGDATEPLVEDAAGTEAGGVLALLSLPQPARIRDEMSAPINTDDEEKLDGSPKKSFTTDLAFRR